MKYLILCFAVFAVASAALYTEAEFTTIKTHSKECQDSTHLDADKLAELRKRHFDENDDKIKEYLFCVFKKMGWQHDDGTVDKAHVETTMSKNDVAKTAMDKCIDKHGSTGPETAFTVFKCWWDHLPADFKMVSH
ncbi:general odorant-binding protein 56d-like [Onthophagus taurus]|uniref:general odorant-binding protein 56d-like n=1 Tax=Onthophagus taurus TaxID=166361 RepID=UPI000C1FFE62|nr:general odorant-binding protein 56a-like [Onthophagus taurus]